MLPFNATAQFGIPAYDKVTYTFVSSGAADNDRVATATYWRNGQSIGTLTFSYVGSTNNIATIERTA